ncbi:hypothetical protein YG5714_0271 [Sulfolobus islandicus Y.G.57.14]|jgi:hypothetical protein|uniref:Uncharacterized protein n=10 Tax=Saccharolobus islandicus TaxID=43080 RepID=M9U3Z3_SACIS|nr:MULTISPECIES: hypothetical protein [Sulfolobaceae]ACP34451.1 hypothetical protein LS215_2966 [Sulfolobus islandicus L.S.2.15]ACP37158.1 hypothetical protein M1425_0268 [Sulfolobus islandicus M.14.25]ACP44564.1 hypothetical protein YG5714_0271 [Sulfolobus islandicus Y.G.57.14]ACP49778.1 hypothetical protein YN1551_2876 [Sulfolobus islandicus Y.N.15.51]ACP54297.1 hypothetical protein M1627_0268 [Sulfolobus islandicus M.16.27]
MIEEEEELKLIKQIFLIINENVPDDCRDLVINRLMNRLMDDIKELGVKETIKKWLGEEDEELIIVD